MIERRCAFSDSSLAPHVKVSSEAGSDETGSHGGDSGHISGTSAENTPEHKSRSPRHLSIPSLVCTSADEVMVCTHPSHASFTHEMQAIANGMGRELLEGCFNVISKRNMYRFSD